MSYNIELLQKNTNHTILSPEKIKSLSTKTLLKVYKTLHSFTINASICDCCGESYALIYGRKDEEEYSKIVDHNFYLYKQTLKSELNTREHIPKKQPSGKPNPKRKLVLLRKSIKDRGLYKLTDSEIRELYNNQCSYFSKDIYGFRGFSLTQILKLVNAIKHSKKNQEKANK